MSDRKEEILLTALSLFAQNGYEAVSVSEIAEALGMTKGALYRHFRNKREIFTSILARMEKRDAEQAEAYRLPQGAPEETPEAYEQAKLSELIEFSRAQFLTWTQDPFAAAFRRMLTLEQYRSEEMTRLYQQYLGEGPLGYVKDLLKALSIPEPEREAVALYAPLFLLYSVYDGTQDPEATVSLLELCLQREKARLEEIRKRGKTV